MCERKAAGRVPAAAVAVALGAVTLSAAAAFLESVAVVILAVMGAAAAAGVAFVIRKVRTGGALYRPRTAALPAPTRPRALGAARPAAIEAPRSVPDMVLDPAAGERISP